MTNALTTQTPDTSIEHLEACLVRYIAALSPEKRVPFLAMWRKNKSPETYKHIVDRVNVIVEQNTPKKPVSRGGTWGKDRYW